MQRKKFVEFRWSLMAPLLGLLAACGGGDDPAPAPLTPTSLIGTISVGEVVRTVSTSLEVSGSHLPTGLSVTVPGDPKASCLVSAGTSASSLKAACQFNRLGVQTLEIRSAAKLLGSVFVTVKSNVTGVTWTSPSTADSGTVKFGESVTFKVAGVNLLADAALGFAVDKCSAANTETGTPSNTLRTFSCTFTNSAGAVAGQMPGVVKDAPGGQLLLDGWKVPVEVAPVGKLTDTGITASQCYAAGGNALVSCTSAAAIALNSKQDGMTGRDVSNADSSDGKLGLSYSAVGSYTKEECVKDNITGLTWEGKPTSGLRAASNTYTHYDNTAAVQFWNGSAYVNPTQAQIDAATNTVGYVAAVNAAKLCGYTDWRLPTADELQGIVDYSVAYPGPTIDGTWFPNTQQYAYWTGTGYAGGSSGAWVVDFGYGFVYGYSRGYGHVRLVR
jgi:hypothetical protein